MPFSVIVAVFALASAVEDRAFVSPADKHTGSRRRRADLASGGVARARSLERLAEAEAGSPGE